MSQEHGDPLAYKASRSMSVSLASHAQKFEVFAVAERAVGNPTMLLYISFYDIRLPRTAKGLGEQAYPSAHAYLSLEPADQ